MSHDQKPARVRVVDATRSQPAVDRRAGDAVPGDSAPPAAAIGGMGASLLLALLFIVAAGIGGTLAAVLLP